MTMDEHQLVAVATAGDREAFAELVRLHQSRLRSLVASAIPSRDDVYDIVQDAFVDAFCHLDQFDLNQDFGPWLRAICRNRMRKFLRARSVRSRHEAGLVDEALAETMPTAPEDGELPSGITELRRCFDTLAERHRQLLELRFHAGLAVKDIATRLGVSANVVSVTLVRLKAALLKCVEAASVKGAS